MEYFNLQTSLVAILGCHVPYFHKVSFHFPVKISSQCSNKPFCDDLSLYFADKGLLFQSSKTLAQYPQSLIIINIALQPFQALLAQICQIKLKSFEIAFIFAKLLQQLNVHLGVIQAQLELRLLIVIVIDDGAGDYMDLRQVVKHNIVYSLSIIQFELGTMQKIHVITQSNCNYFLILQAISFDCFIFSRNFSCPSSQSQNIFNEHSCCCLYLLQSGCSGLSFTFKDPMSDCDFLWACCLQGCYLLVGLYFYWLLTMCWEMDLFCSRGDLISLNRLLVVVLFNEFLLCNGARLAILLIGDYTFYCRIEIVLFFNFIWSSPDDISYSQLLQGLGAFVLSVLIIIFLGTNWLLLIYLLSMSIFRKNDSTALLTFISATYYCRWGCQPKSLLSAKREGRPVLGSVDGLGSKRPSLSRYCRKGRNSTDLDLAWKGIEVEEQNSLLTQNFLLWVRSEGQESRLIINLLLNKTFK